MGWIVAAVIATGGAVYLGSLLHGGPIGVVAVASLAQGDMESTVSTTAQVIPVNDYLARATNGGTIQKLLVHLGDHVQAGQLLVLMKDPYAELRVATATAALRATEAGAENTRLEGSQEDRILFAADEKRMLQEEDAAERNLSTIQALFATGATSQAEVHAAQQRVEAAHLNRSTLHQRMTGRYAPSEFKIWNAKTQEARTSVKAEEANLANVRIASSVSGTAYLIPVRENDFVPPGAELVHVADLSRLQLRADFDEPDMGKLHIGEPVLIRWEGRPDRTWHGHMEHAPLAASLNGSRHVGQSVISIDDAKDDLPPNTTVTATVITEARHQATTLPREALHLDRGTSYVYRVLDGHLVQTPIQTGLITMDAVEVLHGLSPSDQVALHRMDHQDLTSNAAVEIAR
ncbi:MAG: efflux RND transporter periplasmic adaptor subunit [Janthinobacterium lividum]